MADAPLRRMMQHIHQLAGTAPTDTASDRQLLERFAASREQDAFAALVERHGPLVLGVCRRVLRHEQDAEDAFQATFHVLARKAGGIRWHESVANWLYEVARRVAHKARAGSLQRLSRERPSGNILQPASAPETAWHELRQVLDEELDRLPRRYREPLLLCYLEGKTRDEAAQELGWTMGTVKGRLERGREMLRQRLVKRGLSLSAALFGTMLAEGAAKATVPAALVESTVHEAIAGNAAILAEGVLRTMFIGKLKMTALVLLAVAGAGMGIGLAGQRFLSANTPPTQSSIPTTATKPGLPEEFRGVKALVSFDDEEARNRAEEQRRCKQKAEALQKAGLVVLRRVRPRYYFLVDARGRDPAEVLGRLPHQCGAIVFKDGHFREAVPYQANGVWYVPRPCARLKIYPDENHKGRASVERRVKEWTQKLTKVGILVTPKVECENGPSYGLRLEASKRITLLEIFLLAEVEFDLTNKGAHKP